VKHLILIFCYLIYTLNCTHPYFNAWGAVGSDAVDGAQMVRTQLTWGAFGLGADDGAQLTGRKWLGRS
jgi:hypothetical protein